MGGHGHTWKGERQATRFGEKGKGGQSIRKVLDPPSLLGFTFAAFGKLKFTLVGIVDELHWGNVNETEQSCKDGSFSRPAH